jgi:hypothetical protein
VDHSSHHDDRDLAQAVADLQAILGRFTGETIVDQMRLFAESA